MPATPGARCAFIYAECHADILLRARDWFAAEMVRHGVGSAQIDVIAVPGAFKIQLHAQRLARAGAHAAIVACAPTVPRRDIDSWPNSTDICQHDHALCRPSCRATPTKRSFDDGFEHQ